MPANWLRTIFPALLIKNADLLIRFSRPIFRMGPTPAMRPVWLPVPATCEAVPPGPPNPKPLGLHPKIFRGFFPIAFGVGDDDIDQLQNILFAADVGEGVVFHALFEVDGVEDLDAVRLIDDLPAGIPHGLSVFVQLGGASPQHGSHLRQKLPFRMRTRESGKNCVR